jgi:curved DNA-binding protein CbpA
VDDYYAILRVRPTASKAEIDRAYRRLVRAYHPDLQRGASPEIHEHAEAMLKRVNQAHRVLGDPQRRLAYDRERARPTVAASAPASRASRARPSAAPQPPVVETTSHWQGGGPLDIEWTTAPPRGPKRGTDVFSAKTLIFLSVLIILFALLLAVLWRPGAARRNALPTPAPTAIVSPTR